MLTVCGFITAAMPANALDSFIDTKSGCGSILPWQDEWQKLAPTLPNPERVALFDSSFATGLEWKRLYLPRRQLTRQELSSDAWQDLMLSKHAPDPYHLEPGLLINNQGWIDFLQSCPNAISSNRAMSPGKFDWVAPYFFELYELPLDQQKRKVIVTRFKDHSERFAGEYLALYLGDRCPAEKIFVSQGGNQELEFLQRNDKLVMALKTPGKRLIRYLTFVPETVDNSYFVEVCRGILNK